MKQKSFCSIVLLFCAFTLGAAEDHHHAPTPEPTDSRLAFLTALEGRWSGPPMMEGGPPTVLVFETTAGGNAVIETEFPGTPMEMVTVYHLDGSHLIAKHYCMLGNQPTLIASKEVTDNGLNFECDGSPGNAKSHDEEHVHGWSMKLSDAGTLDYQFRFSDKGNIETKAFSLSKDGE